MRPLGASKRKEETMKALIKKLVRDEQGATAVEYGIIAGVVVVALIATLAIFRGKLISMFTSAGNAVSP